jgi:pantetheine-phosphate adenylyltransferase
MKNIKSAVYPGSFDPIHPGHINIIKRASKLFDLVYVVVSYNLDKSKQTPLLERYQNVRTIINKMHFKNIKVMMNKTLTVNALKQLKCSYIIRSIRDTNDFECEIRSAKINHYLDNNIETVILFADKNLKSISSREIREAKRQVRLSKDRK